MTQEEQNEALIRRWIEEVWNQKRPAVIEELLTTDCIAHGMGPNGKALIGPGPFRQAYELLTGAFPDLVITVDQMIASGDTVASHLTCRATHQGDHLGIPASGTTVTFPCMTMARIRDGKIVEGRNVIDLMAAFQQIKAVNVSEALP